MSRWDDLRVTKIAQELAECQVNDDHFEFRQLRGICVGSGFAASTKYSAWDRETHLNQNNIALFTKLGLSNEHEMCCREITKCDHTECDHNNRTWEDANHAIIATALLPLLDL